MILDEEYYGKFKKSLLSFKPLMLEREKTKKRFNHSQQKELMRLREELFTNADARICAFDNLPYESILKLRTRRCQACRENNVCSKCCRSFPINPITGKIPNRIGFICKNERHLCKKCYLQKHRENKQ